MYRDGVARADAAGQQIVRDPALADAIRDKDQERIQTRLQEVAATADTAKVLLELDGQGAFESGGDPVVAPARNALQDQDGRPVGRLVTSVEGATGFAAQFAELNEAETVIAQGRDVLAASSPQFTRVPLPAEGHVNVADTDYRVKAFPLEAFEGAPLTMSILLAGRRRLAAQ